MRKTNLGSFIFSLLDFAQSRRADKMGKSIVSYLSDKFDSISQCQLHFSVWADWKQFNLDGKLGLLEGTVG